MKTFLAVLLISFTFLFTGCPARSVHPLFTQTEAVFNPSLVGTWVNNDESYTFEKLHEKNYRLVTRPLNESDSMVYAVTLGKIGATWFIDSYPIVNSKDHHYLSVHVFTRMKMQGDTLSIATLEADWLLKMITAKKIKITHVQRENEIILTASTTELQNFFATIAGTNDAFSDQNVLVRTK